MRKQAPSRAPTAAVLASTPITEQLALLLGDDPMVSSIRHAPPLRERHPPRKFPVRRSHFSSHIALLVWALPRLRLPLPARGEGGVRERRRRARHPGAQNHRKAPSPSFARLTRPLPAQRGEVIENPSRGAPCRPSFAKPLRHKNKALLDSPPPRMIPKSGVRFSDKIMRTRATANPAPSPPPAAR
jgi:hypothetical protein